MLTYVDDTMVVFKDKDEMENWLMDDNC